MKRLAIPASIMGFVLLVSFGGMLVGCGSGSSGSSGPTGTSTSATVTSPTVRIGSPTGAAIKQLLGINAGPLPASSSLSGDLTANFQSIGVKAVRTHDFLIYPSGATGPGPLDMSTMYPSRTASPSLQGSYDFTVSDRYFAAVNNGGFEPFFRLGDSAGLSHAPLPAERANWEQAAVQVLKHYTQGQWSGYSSSVRDVEIWNEPDSAMFWNRSKSEFMSLYIETAPILRSAFPSLRIGGPGFTTGAMTDTSSTGWLATFLDSVRTANAPLDFLSFHVYTNDYNQPATLATNLRATLDAKGFTSTQIYITEWNTSTDPQSNLSQAQALRSGAQGVATLSAAWIKMQDAPVDRLFHYRGSDPNANTPEDYGLYLGNGTAKRTAYAFQQWALLAGTAQRLAVTVSGDSGLLAIAGKDSVGKTVIMVVNTANAPSSWTPVDSSNVALSGTWQLTSISDASSSPAASTPTFPVSIPAYGLQVLMQR